MGSRGLCSLAGVEGAEPSLRGTGQSPDGSAGNHNSIQTRRCAHNPKGTSALLFCCAVGTNYRSADQFRPSPALPETESEHRERTFFVRLQPTLHRRSASSQSMRRRPPTGAVVPVVLYRKERCSPLSCGAALCYYFNLLSL